MSPDKDETKPQDEATETAVAEAAQRPEDTPGAAPEQDSTEEGARGEQEGTQTGAGETEELMEQADRDIRRHC